jgi:hypothetical protein
MANYGSTLTEGNERKMIKELCTRRRKGRKARRDKEKILLYTKNNII